MYVSCFAGQSVSGLFMKWPLSFPLLFLVWRRGWCLGIITIELSCKIRSMYKQKQTWGQCTRIWWWGEGYFKILRNKCRVSVHSQSTDTHMLIAIFCMWQMVSHLMHRAWSSPAASIKIISIHTISLSWSTTPHFQITTGRCARWVRQWPNSAR